MSIAETILPEFEHEMALTRRFLERVPEQRFSWKPHPKSMALGDLAEHLARLPWWGTVTLTQDSFDLNPPGAPRAASPSPQSRRELLELFDRNVAEARAAIAGTDDARFQGTWSLLDGGQTVFAAPRAAVLRSFFLSHIVHHRAQFGLYLRLNDVPVPGSYGPSADEGVR